VFFYPKEILNDYNGDHFAVINVLYYINVDMPQKYYMNEYLFKENMI